MALCDIYTNFICIVLSFNYFNKYYYKLCGKCDSKCHRLWGQCLRKNSEKAEVNLTPDDVGSKSVPSHAVTSLEFSVNSNVTEMSIQ